MRSIIACASLAAIFSFNALPARATDVAATDVAPSCSAYIDTLPYTISAPGTYCLRKDLTSSDYIGGVVVYASDVTVDCRNRSMAVAAGTDRNGTTGVYLDMGVSRSTVQNCSLNGFDIGVRTPFDGVDNAVRNNRVNQFISAGIQGGGDGFQAVNNRITNGLSLYNGATGIDVMGNFLQGSSSGQVVMNNLVAGLNGLIATGIRVTDSEGLRVINNHVQAVKGVAPNGAASGMTFNRTPGLQLVNNAISALAPDQAFTPMQSVTQPALCRGNSIYNSYQASFYTCARTLDNVNVATPAY